MSAETTALALAAIVQAGQIALAGASMHRDVGMEWNASPRDEEPKLSALSGRLRRAVDNHFEGLIFFTIAVVVVSLADTGNLVTAACAWIYLLARVLYVPAYAYGWVPWRSVIWGVGFAATMIMILVSLF